MRKNILLLETISDGAKSQLENATDISLHTAYEVDAIHEVVSRHSIHAIITRGKGQVRAELMDKCPELQIIARCGVGLDNIDVDKASERKIKVVNAPNSNANTIAEHTISLLLMLQRNMYQAINMVKDGRWEDRAKYQADELHGKTLAILGLGNIGAKVAKIADALGMRIIYWSNHKKDVHYEYVSFDDIFTQADCISIHLPLVAGTKHLIDAAVLAKMKPTAILINTARGNIIDQNALYDALEKGIIGGFASDVLTDEPPKENDPLISLDNVLITAHIGSLTTSTFNFMCEITVENTLALLRNEEINESCIFNLKELGGNTNT